MTRNGITRSVRVPLAPGAAFDLFADGFDRWWPKEHCFCGEAALDRVFIDLEAMTWGEVTCDGHTALWGSILAAQKPDRLELGWQMDPRVSPWIPDPIAARASIVDLRFMPEPEGTLVTLRHHGFDRHGEGAEIMASVIVGLDRWAEWLADFATLAAGQEGPQD